MIILTNPLLYAGRMIPQGAKMGGLDQAFEAAIIAAGNGVLCEVPVEEPVPLFPVQPLGEDPPVDQQDEEEDSDSSVTEEIPMTIMGRGL